MATAGTASKQSEIYTHESPSLVYALGWSARPDRPFRLAVGSFIEDYNNRVEILQRERGPGALPAQAPPTVSHLRDTPR